MKDFEKYIKENKLLFDEHKADKRKLWACIEEKLDQENIPKTKTIWKFPLLKIAASIFILLGVYTAASLIINSLPIQKQTVVDVELQEIDMHYSKLVQQQVELVKISPHLSSEEKTEFLSFMNELDEEYLVLKNEMKKNVDNERVLEAVVSNYKKRIELIENLLVTINKSKNIDDENGYIL